MNATTFPIPYTTFKAVFKLTQDACMGSQKVFPAQLRWI